MSKEAKGWLGTNSAPHGRQPLVGYWVYLDSPEDLIWGDTGTYSDSFGLFHIGRYAQDLQENAGRHRKLRIRVKDPMGRELRLTSSAEVTDVKGDGLLELGDVLVDPEDAFGAWVTVNRGGSHVEVGKVTFLTDQDAFAYAAAMIDRAKEQILMSQLNFALPPKFNADATQEDTALVFDFHPPLDQPGRSPGYDLDHPRAAGVGDARPERMLLQALDRHVQVRILLNKMAVPLWLQLTIGVLLFPFMGSVGLGSVRDLVRSTTDVEEAEAYFRASGRSKVTVRAFEQPLLSAGVMHAKLLAVDGRVLSIGSPFSQSYVDGQEHRIESWIRGSAGDSPRHDAGFAVTGPAAVSLYRTLALLWDDGVPEAEKLPAEQVPLGFVPPTGAPPSILDHPDDGECSVQVVRTMTRGRVKNVDADGEKGILEAYLRGIGQAEDFIYLETQYFTNDAIGDALCERLRLRPKLQAIVLLNMNPDTPFYPFKQRRLITRIRRELSKDDKGPARFRVFTRWRHEVGRPGQPRPRLMPVYIHAKVGIIDNNWATVGSANLDGLSLDSSLPSDFLRGLVNRFGAHSQFEQRAIEVNGLMMDDESSHAVDALRRKLWAEHLGYFDAHAAVDIHAPDLQAANRPPGPPDPVSGALNAGPPQGGWLKLWHDRSTATLQQLKNNPAQSTAGMASVLPWPEDNTTHKKTRDYLNTLGIHPYAVVPLSGGRPFAFKSGNWAAEAAEDD